MPQSSNAVIQVSCREFPVSNDRYLQHLLPELRSTLNIPEGRPAFDSLTAAQQEGVYQSVLAQQQASNEADRSLRSGVNMGYSTDWLIQSAGLMDYHRRRQEEGARNPGVESSIDRVVN